MVANQISDGAREHLPAVDVATLRWPAEAQRRDYLAARGEPRLLLIEAGDPVPETDALQEDWIRVPVLIAEMEARRDALARRTAVRPDLTSRSPMPVLDDQGVLRVGERCVILPPIEVRILRVFLQSVASLVTRETLSNAVWPDGEPKSNTLGVRLSRLRKRLAPLGLSIETFVNHGYMLQLSIPAPE